MSTDTANVRHEVHVNGKTAPGISGGKLVEIVFFNEVKSNLLLKPILVSFLLAELDLSRQKLQLVLHIGRETRDKELL